LTGWLADWLAGWLAEEDDADDGLTHEGYADDMQLVAPDQTSLNEFSRTRNVLEHARTLVAVAIVLDRSSTLQYEMETKQLHAQRGADGNFRYERA
jgi:hypothetical protein